jgi:23S rRNA (adenine2503-C2)-methyltransferase
LLCCIGNRQEFLKTEKMIMNLYGKTKKELKEFVAENKYPKFTATQLAEWMYQKHEYNFSEMTNISKKIREELTKNARIETVKPERVSVSKDGTKKYLFHYPGKGHIEAVYIPDNDRHTLCISSQSGCKFNCEFCMTGKMGFTADLTAGEIINQFQNIPERDKITNIVYMGMGEPLDNVENVVKSIDLFTSDYAFGMSNRRITVSTIGLIPGLKRILADGRSRLALSMHSPFDVVRQKIMPVQRAHPLEEVLHILTTHEFNDDRRLSIEYIMLKGINDRPEDINRLTKILHGIRCRVNLIRFHEIPNTQLKGTADADIEAFKYKLRQKGILATVRKSRGQDIEAACGMLSGKAKSDV